MNSSNEYTGADGTRSPGDGGASEHGSDTATAEADGRSTNPTLSKAYSTTAINNVGVSSVSKEICLSDQFHEAWRGLLDWLEDGEQKLKKYTQVQPAGKMKQDIDELKVSIRYGFVYH